MIRGRLQINKDLLTGEAGFAEGEGCKQGGQKEGGMKTASTPYNPFLVFSDSDSTFANLPTH